MLSFFRSFKSLSHNYTTFHKISQRSFPIRSPKNTSYKTLHDLALQAYPTSLPLSLPLIPTAQVTLVFFTIFLLSYLQIFAFYCSHCLDFLLFPQPINDGSFASFTSQLKCLPFRKTFPDHLCLKWSLLITLYFINLGLSFTVLHSTRVFNLFTCLPCVSSTRVLQESRGLLSAY